MKRWNHYKCPKCGGVTIARHDDEGVTPFLLRCRIRTPRSVLGWRGTKACNGMAESTFFLGSQDESQTPHVVFFRPTDALEAIEAINKEPRQHREAMLEHWRMGGALLREHRS